MNATRILWGQILLVSLVVLVFVWTATELTAWRLGFQPQLGAPWFELAGWPVYQPPAFFWWWFSFDAYAPHVFHEGGDIAASGGFASIAVAIDMSVWRAREAKNVTTYGSARWAKADEIRAAVCSATTAWCSDDSSATIFGMTARSTCCALRRPAPARASAWSFQPF